MPVYWHRGRIFMWFPFLADTNNFYYCIEPSSAGSARCAIPWFTEITGLDVDGVDVVTEGRDKRVALCVVGHTMPDVGDLGTDMVVLATLDASQWQRKADGDLHLSGAEGRELSLDGKHERMVGITSIAGGRIEREALEVAAAVDARHATRAEAHVAVEAELAIVRHVAVATVLAVGCAAEGHALRHVDEQQAVGSKEVDAVVAVDGPHADLQDIEGDPRHERAKHDLGDIGLALDTGQHGRLAEHRQCDVIVGQRLSLEGLVDRHRAAAKGILVGDVALKEITRRVAGHEDVVGAGQRAVQRQARLMRRRAVGLEGTHPLGPAILVKDTHGNPVHGRGFTGGEMDVERVDRALTYECRFL